MEQQSFLLNFKKAIGEALDFSALIDSVINLSLQSASVENQDDLYNIATGRGRAFDIFGGNSILHKFKHHLLKARRCSVEDSEEEFV